MSTSGIDVKTAFLGLSSACFLANAGILRFPDPGTGSPGVPIMPLISVADHRLSGVRRLTVDTLNTPLLVATRCSPVLMTNPTQQPSSQRSSNLPTRCWVFGILNSTVSPMGTSFALVRRPFINWYAVRPFSRTRHMVRICPACRRIQGTTASDNCTWQPIFDSRSDRKVLTRPAKS